MTALAAVRSPMSTAALPDCSISSPIFPLPQMALLPFNSATPSCRSLPMLAGWAVAAGKQQKLWSHLCLPATLPQVSSHIPVFFS